MKKILTILTVMLFAASLFISCESENENPEPKEITRIIQMDEVESDGKVRVYYYKYDNNGVFTNSCVIESTGDTSQQMIVHRLPNGNAKQMDIYAGEKTQPYYSVLYNTFNNNKPTSVNITTKIYGRLYKQELVWEEDKVVQLTSYQDVQRDNITVESFEHDANGNISKSEMYIMPRKDTLYIAEFTYDNKYNYTQFLPIEINTGITSGYEYIFWNTNNVIKEVSYAKRKSTNEMIESKVETDLSLIIQYTTDDKNRVVEEKYEKNGKTIIHRYKYKTFIIE